ncbi:MAG: hypothetical protein N3E37_05800 [Candidatus Micrarchaeota archaeon]|nr:hypothetical protein [Candidatus Micrarchaeota archaeon]
MALIKRSNLWWIDIYHNGKRHRFSTKTSDRKKAEEIYSKVLFRLNEATLKSQVEAESEQPVGQKESHISYEEFYEKHY